MEVLRSADGRWEGGLEVEGYYMVLGMSEEQLKAAETEVTAQVEDGVEEISEEDLAGVAGGKTLASGVLGSDW